MSKKKALIFIFLPLIVLGSVVVGIILGGMLTPSDINNKTLLFSNNRGFNAGTKLNEILNFIEDMYVDTVDKEDLTERSISSMLTQLDPHSYYIPARDFDGMIVSDLNKGGPIIRMLMCFFSFLDVLKFGIS